METLIQIIFKFLQEIDSILEQNIKHFVSNYSLINPRFPIKYEVIVLSIKVVIYNLLLLLIFAALKIVFRSNSFVSLLFAVSLIIFGAATFIIFLGFFQVLFT